MHAHCKISENINKQTEEGMGRDKVSYQAEKATMSILLSFSLFSISMLKYITT